MCLTTWYPSPCLGSLWEVRCGWLREVTVVRFVPYSLTPGSSQSFCFGLPLGRDQLKKLLTDQGWDIICHARHSLLMKPSQVNPSWKLFLGRYLVRILITISCDFFFPFNCLFLWTWVIIMCDYCYLFGNYIVFHFVPMFFCFFLFFNFQGVVSYFTYIQYNWFWFLSKSYFSIWSSSPIVFEFNLFIFIAIDD